MQSSESVGHVTGEEHARVALNGSCTRGRRRGLTRCLPFYSFSRTHLRTRVLKLLLNSGFAERYRHVRQM